VETLNRYTELPYVLHTLQTKAITLLSPGSWDDKNDTHFVECYRKQMKLKSVVALCLTEAAQTYHHWKVFTQGASGACLNFKKAAFLNWIADTPGLEGRGISYKTVKQLKETPPRCADLPFLKRKAYEHEKEFRLLCCSKTERMVAKNFDFSLSMIDSIVLNPWLPKVTVGSLKKLIGSIHGCSDIPVYRATIVENDVWRRLASNAAA
jgi:hypothetical protein